MCHGFDDTAIDFKSPPTAECSGTVCAKNPREALHKIRFGLPGVDMVALAMLGLDDPVDILAYCQTRPTEEGRLSACQWASP